MKTKKEIKLMNGLQDGQLKAYLHEYPWLEEYLPETVLSLKTSRANEELLESNGVRTIRSLLGDVIDVEQNIIFINENGKYIGQLGFEHHPAPTRTLFNWFPKAYDTKIPNERIFEGILRFSNEKHDFGSYYSYCLPHFIVTIDNGYVTVHKPPKLTEVEYGGHFPVEPSQKLMNLAYTVRNSLTTKKEVAKDEEYEKALMEIRSA